MTIQSIQEEIVEEFSIFDDWMDKYEHIIESGKELESMSDELKLESNLVKGCQSQVWLHAEMEGTKLVFQADSDAIITKGLVSLMVRTLSGHTPKEILDAELSFVDEIGLKEHLSPTRSNGLVSMIKKIKLYALGFQTKIGS
ncbi:MAG: SufE family protein [Flavobacteriales bacterium]|nr:SufE family protein [Flavobacteriales bacterium]